MSHPSFVIYLLLCTAISLAFGNIIYPDQVRIPAKQMEGPTPAPATCNPLADPSSLHYIVAYGSLMEQASKDRTDKNTGESIPVQIQGYSREWNLKGDGAGAADTTYLGVVPDKHSNFNGAIFALSTQNILDTLKSYDLRESFYCRHLVDPQNIQVYKTTTGPADQNETTLVPLLGEMSKGSQFWIYVNKQEFTGAPRKEFPVVQSYVDIFISGCLELQEKFNLMIFALNCVETTKGWNGDFWVNDRIFPRRPFIYQPKASKIDKVLEDSIQAEFMKVRIEG